MSIDLMKEYRKIDDNIMLRMNTTDTHSEASCKEFFKHLSDAYTRREKAVESCLKVSNQIILNNRVVYINKVLLSLWLIDTRRKVRETAKDN